MRSVSALVWRMIRMVVTVALLSACRASEYEYWHGPYSAGPIYGKSPQCVGIPEDLRLCHGVGYSDMLLPNLLEHETMEEVKQQASSWVPLVHKKCHPGTQVFLCSLFAPVCLDRPIYPCRKLCEVVRDGCTPIMEAFGYPWPEMLTCTKFPEHDVCISLTNNATESPESTGHSPICPPCDNEMKTDTMLEHMCASEFDFALHLIACSFS
ncbi:Secreted frizzled- protein 1 [Xenotaenia resolanae]|uniref:Secreted frizzled- protein 1 n=1 Tax=Xenotaenia resolanae TaxID=208358 RepID=A0ABV0WJY6_9TELE